jgi:predicted phage terminase large subunit-like protein
MSFEITPAEYKVILQNDLMTFTERSFRELNPETSFSSSPHLEVMVSKLEQCRQGKLRRLIINLPPRSLKSHSISVAFAAWLLGHRPETQIICASYGQDLADKHARDCRTLMSSNFYQSLFSRARLSPEKQSVSEFVTTRQGFRLSTSVGGVLTGRGADFIILDDPLKPDDAMSEPKRKSVNDWYDNTLSSRLNSKENGVIIIVMQRLHQDDLVGHVLEQHGWEVLSFPAIAEADETFAIENIFGQQTFSRKLGEALHSERESLQTLQSIRGNMGIYNFSSQYQQCPIPVGGAMVKLDWLRYYEPGTEPSAFGHVLQSWDTANKSGELNDFSVCTTWGVHQKKHYYLLDVFRRRLDFPGLKKAVREQDRLYRPRTILIEDRASGTQLIQDLKTEGLYRIKPYLPPSSSDKVMRLHAQTAVFESGRVLLPKNATWLPEYLKELAAFPGSKHDDQVDSTTQALEHITRVLCKTSIYDVL